MRPDEAEPGISSDREGSETARAPRQPIEIEPLDWTPPFDWPALFGRSGPVELEIGCGKGMFLKEAARANADTLYLGVERAGKFYRVAVRRLSRARLDTVRLMRADGLDVLARWVAPATLRTIHVYFPDPWPKKRHHKRRVFRPALLDLAARALVVGGELRAATDDAPYAELVRTLLAADPRFTALPWPDDAPDRYASNYELKWRRAGRTLWWGRYRLEGLEHAARPEV